MTINERFTLVRDHLGMNQTQFGTALNIGQRDVWRYETGKTEKIPQEIFHILHDKYGINLNWLITGLGTINLTKAEEEAKTGVDTVQEPMAEYNFSKKNKPLTKCANCATNEAIIVTLKDHIAYLQKQNDTLISGLIAGSEKN